ncbi:hypothetical protein AXX17_ATUG04240 [Arabidopsis thaliana]|uniref:Enoyl reductase (ER) domain-containing protein n=1 Tax=Arabidopsis thaliana TaxID=3702 RepID=A0A178U7G1_ARATH|nr:hypothetical protein AXX17_ATUG04240 [Arabidopsis thaliana]
MDSRNFVISGWFRVAVQALVVIAEADGACSSSVIAQELKAHATFLRRVTVQLVSADIIVAREGRSGGYQLALPPQHITLAQVYRAIQTVNLSEETAAAPRGNRVKAIQIHRYGDIDNLVYEEVPDPVLSAGEALIRVHAVGVNPADFRGRQGLAKSIWGPSPFPVILGYDISGEVVEVSSGTTSFVPGDQVYGMIRFPYIGKGYAEYIAAPLNEIARKPRSIDHQHTAALPMPALTAWQAIFDKGQLQKGETILIHGASGGVGHVAAQLAKWKGARVIGLASERNADFLRHIGVDTVIDYMKQPLEAVVKEEEVDIVLYAVPTVIANTNSNLESSLRTLKRGGRLVSIARNLDAELEQNKLFQNKEIQSFFFSVQSNASQLVEIAQLVDSGALTAQLQTVIPLQEARKAHELIETGHVRGKIVLQVTE